jgi:SAM-dependent methyltransferase
MLGRAGAHRDFDLAERKFAEAYQEMGHYNEVAESEACNVTQSKSYQILAPALIASETDALRFPFPPEVWLDATYESAAQWDAYSHIAPLARKRTLQIGGKGIHAVKFLLAGAAESWLLTPMVGECKIAIALARAAGVEKRLRCVVGIAEDIPVASERFDAIFSGGCVHHMVTRLAFPEIARILKRGGRFAALDPWRAPLYGIGTKIFGKREPNVFCKPLTHDRVAPLNTAFSRGQLIHHGALTRYPFLALKKMGLPVSLKTMSAINRIDDAFCTLAGLRRFGSSVALLGEK